MVRLWGKDLYQHLSEIYQKKARYCIVFASDDYARKAWTNHELKSAQARAFSEKGSEYILPVRFDSTEIPGVLPTVGYLSFEQEGAVGICRAALSKLGAEPTVQNPQRQKSPPCIFSPRAQLLSKELGVRIFPTIEESSWADEIGLSVAADTSEVDSLFSRFRNHSEIIVIAYGFDVALAKIGSAARTVAGGRARWTLKFTPERTDFSNDFEMGTSSTSADQFAERRVRRLLLNERPALISSGRDDMIAAANEAFEENLVVGLNSIAKIRQSSFPPLYREFGSDTQKFLEIAWISAAADLKLSAAIQHIDYLNLALDGEFLNAEFSGRRQRKYINVDPYKIDVSGRLALSSPTP